MSFAEYTGTSISANSADEIKAAEIFSHEILLRTGIKPSLTDAPLFPCVTFRRDSSIESKDSYAIESTPRGLVLTANGIRGFIFAIGLFLRKTEYINGRIMLIEDISGFYTPCKPIRGHQLGYRPTPNTYDKWTIEDYGRYCLELMFFGANTVEHMAYEKGKSNRNEIMQYDEEELLALASELADDLELDVSLWSPNCEDTLEEAVENRRRVFALCKRFDAVFPPGGDPGELSPRELFKRCEAFSEELKKRHPHAGVWPSAQQPHGYSGWGDEFIEELNALPDSIAGVIQGPNRAFELDELRRKVPSKYPIRFYPDITHNVRCEYPVHFLKDDFNYALCTVSGRESPNPRPREYALLHKITEKYVVGSVSYSEGVNDDLNKAIWSALDFDPHSDVITAVEDYTRLFFYGADTQKLTDAILGLERNWEGEPEANPQIDYTLSLLESAAEEYPPLHKNYRYNMLLLRAECDSLVRKKVICQGKAVKKAGSLILKGRLAEAKEVLLNARFGTWQRERADIERLAGLLYEQIGMQLGTKDYHADGWERGAVLDTVDLPVSDLQWLLCRFSLCENKSEEKQKAYLRRCVLRNSVAPDEYYFSLALDGLDALNIKQEPCFYMDFQGDRPDKNNGSLPVCMFKLFDHFVFRAKTAGFAPDTDYVLMITYKDSPCKETRHHKITANGYCIYEGAQFGGEENSLYTREMLPTGYTARMYTLPSEVFENGCLTLEISEPTRGFELCEFRITKNAYGEESSNEPCFIGRNKL